ncbi:hypothetical protein GF342_05945 [Candidatus Woesearchaeota archaeon]|nr:hypothetical protein [Candidatus Woesearchaeota archaeon]
MPSEKEVEQLIDNALAPLLAQIEDLQRAQEQWRFTVLRFKRRLQLMRDLAEAP